LSVSAPRPAPDSSSSPARASTARTTASWVDESSPAEAAGFRAECLREGEALVRGAACRAPSFVSAAFTARAAAGQIDRALAGLPVTRQGRPLYGNRIHRDDGAGILEHLMNLQNPRVAVSRRLIPTRPTAKPSAHGWPNVRLSIPAPDASDSGSDADRSNKRCSNRRILDSGYQFRYPTFREGFAALLDDGGFGQIDAGIHPPGQTEQLVGNRSGPAPPRRRRGKPRPDGRTARLRRRTRSPGASVTSTIV
jgi:hypothetical protein